MRGVLRAILFLLAILGGSLWMGGRAHAFPPGQQVKISCDQLSIDPPSVSWIKVRFYGTINGVPFSRTVSYGAPTPHIARVDMSALPSAAGPSHVTATANGGWLGVSPTKQVTISCADPKSQS